jgi:phosphatidylserine/phosphatidylglycerophosphate/cardiolipin synthase-like enzyme
MLEAKKRGVDVVVVLDRSQRTAKYSSATFFNNVGITVFIDDRHAIAHNKIILIDGKTIITGSFNFTKAAEEHNTENLLIIKDEADLYAAYEKNFQADLLQAVKYQGIVRLPADATTRPAIQPSAATQPGGELLYATTSGKHYHRTDCSYLKDRRFEAITLAEAKAKGLKPCSRCMPPE